MANNTKEPTVSLHRCSLTDHVEHRVVFVTEDTQYKGSVRLRVLKLTAQILSNRHVQLETQLKSNIPFCCLETRCSFECKVLHIYRNCWLGEREVRPKACLYPTPELRVLHLAASATPKRVHYLTEWEWVGSCLRNIESSKTQN